MRQKRTLMRLTKLTFLAAFLLMAACAYGQDVHYNYDRSANFGTYRTYQWVDIPGGSVPMWQVVLSMAILAGTALAQAWILVGGLPRLVGTDYGRVALVKLALLLILLALATANRFRYAPAMRRPGGADASRGLRRSIAVETAVGLLAVLAASLLADLPPALHQQPVWPFA